MKIQKTFDCSLQDEVNKLIASDNAKISTREQLPMIAQKISLFIKSIWVKLESAWENAGEIQKRIDATRAREIHKYDCFRWHI